MQEEIKQDYKKGAVRTKRLREVLLNWTFWLHHQLKIRLCNRALQNHWNFEIFLPLLLLLISWKKMVKGHPQELQVIQVKRKVSLQSHRKFLKLRQMVCLPRLLHFIWRPRQCQPTSGYIHLYKQSHACYEKLYCVTFWKLRKSS